MITNQKLRKYEILKQKKSIDYLFEKGRFHKDFPFFIRYAFVEDSDYIAKVIFAAPKKKFKRAVDRNRIKRLMREAYRLNKNIMYDCLKNSNRKILIHISYFDTTIAHYNIFSSKMIKFFNVICDLCNEFEKNN